ncbi:hypothetical protein BKP35_16185 [Anaerobacillus arseniciselenatis]|uniref:Uncharacterized protein n=2 Tax=Anaerobacillus arseniciselenatis TaxID=85682 RepID=A0A1S2LCZ1_9BACI|nr:hypothetical protein BKP35_16185 [Anaerobacillus arseniciselenatis]
MWDKKYRFSLITNESEEMNKEWVTENFKPSIQKVELEAMDSIEAAIDIFKEKCKKFSNEDWDWECNERGTYGEIRFGNDVDGLGLVYEIELIE